MVLNMEPLNWEVILMLMAEVTFGKRKMNALQELLQSFEEKFEWTVANMVILHGK